MGRVGIELTTFGLKVRANEPRRSEANGNVLHRAQIETETSCSEMQGVETNLYARSYARRVPH